MECVSLLARLPVIPGSKSSTLASHISLRDCLCRQDFTPRIHISPADFAVITNNGAMCDERGQLGPKEFEVQFSAAHARARRPSPLSCALP